MYSKLMILPLSVDGAIYVVQDETGKTICTGTRDVCEVLLHIIGIQKAGVNSASQADLETIQPRADVHHNVRSAIVI